MVVFNMIALFSAASADYAAFLTPVVKPMLSESTIEGAEEKEHLGRALKASSLTKWMTLGAVSIITVAVVGVGCWWFFGGVTTAAPEVTTAAPEVTTAAPEASCSTAPPAVANTVGTFPSILAVGSSDASSLTCDAGFTGTVTLTCAAAGAVIDAESTCTAG